MTLDKLKKELATLADKKQSVILQSFFKTGKGEYGEGDIFIGIKMPVLRNTAKKYKDLSLDETFELLTSGIHEHRMTALLILNFQYNSGDDGKKEKIVKEYMKNVRKYVNNWDLVDLSAPYFAGDYFFRNRSKRKKLYSLAKSNSLWERRVAVIATYHFIRQGEYEDTFNIVEILMNDKHDLIHKAAGWMLREIGKRIDEKIEKQFIDKHFKNMPRTMLRYAIERFPENERKKYLKK